MSGRLLATIVDQHLRPTRHGENCDGQCKPGCPIREYEADMNGPILSSEVAAAKAEEERFQSLARGDFSHLEVGDEVGQPAH